MRRLLLLLTVVISSAVTSVASADVMLNDLVLPYPTINQVEDFSVERLIKGAMNNNPANAKIVEVGDTLQAIVVFDTMNAVDLNGFLGFGSNYQLTALSEIVVLQKNPTLDGMMMPIPGRFDFVFGPGLPLGVAVALYENPSIDGTTAFDATQAPANGIMRATSGNLVATFGFGELDDFWVSIASPDDISQFRSDPAIQGGDFFFGLSVLSNPGGLLIGPNGVDTSVLSGFMGGTTNHDIVGNGNLLAPSAGVNAGWDAQDNTSFNFVGPQNEIVPEPTSILVWGGMTLAGLAAYRRRRNRA